MSGPLHTQTALPLGKSSQYPLDRRLGGPQGQSGHWSRENSCSCCESNTGHPASSLSQYRLRYPDSVIITIILITGKNHNNVDDDGGGSGDDGGDSDAVWYECLAMDVIKWLMLWRWLIL
jgi:hypothetical protein